MPKQAGESDADEKMWLDCTKDLREGSMIAEMHEAKLGQSFADLIAAPADLS